VEDKISLQIFLQKLNSNTKLQKLKRRRNTKTIAETEQKYQIAEADTKLQKLKSVRFCKPIIINHTLHMALEYYYIGKCLQQKVRVIRK
jgi:hypothetical protein